MVDRSRRRLPAPGATARGAESGTARYVWRRFRVGNDRRRPALREACPYTDTRHECPASPYRANCFSARTAVDLVWNGVPEPVIGLADASRFHFHPAFYRFIIAV